MNFRLPVETRDPEPPPILGKWSNVYAVVLGWLLFVILVFYGFTRYFS